MNNDRSPGSGVRGGRRGPLVLAVAIALCGVLGVGTAAVAGGERRTSEVAAELDFTHVEGRFRLCDGADGTYDEEMIVARGHSSGDPRLTGPFEIRVSSLDRLTDDGHLGAQSGTFVVFDESTGRRKVDGSLNLVQHYGYTLGVLTGQVWDLPVKGNHSWSGPGKLTALLWVGFLDNNGALDIVGGIGGTAPVDRLPAVIQYGGGCSGRYEAFSFDLP